MVMLPITSSMLSHVGYDEPSLTLYVQFHPSKKQAAAGVAGDVWAYKNYIHGMPETPEEGWGRWFLANIKGRYEGAVVERESSGPPITTIEKLQPILDDLPSCECGARPCFSVDARSITFYDCSLNPSWAWKRYDILDVHVSISDLFDGEAPFFIESIKAYLRMDKINPHPTSQL